LTLLSGLLLFYSQCWTMSMETAYPTTSTWIVSSVHPLRRRKVTATGQEPTLFSALACMFCFILDDCLIPKFSCLAREGTCVNILSPLGWKNVSALMPLVGERKAIWPCRSTFLSQRNLEALGNLTWNNSGKWAG